MLFSQLYWNHCRPKIVRVWLWNRNSNVMSQLHFHAPIFFIYQLSESWERIHKPGRTFNGFSRTFLEISGFQVLLAHFRMEISAMATLTANSSIVWHSFRNMYEIFIFSSFVPSARFLYPMKTLGKLTISWCLQAVEKGCIGNKWVKENRHSVFWNINGSVLVVVSERKNFPTKIIFCIQYCWKHIWIIVQNLLVKFS